MKKYIITTCLLLGSFVSFGQCPAGTGHITLASQADVDNFAINYPGCDVVPHDLIINNSSVTNLNGLIQITEIVGSLVILGAQIPDYTGLDNLQSIGGNFHVPGRPENFIGLGNLHTIGGSLYAYNAHSIVNFEGLDALTSIAMDTDNVDGIIIEESDDLISFEGLSSLTTVGKNFQLLNNANLINFEGLESLNYIEGRFNVYGNTNLINFNGLEGLVTIDNHLLITNNLNLQSLSGLSSLETVTLDFSVSNCNSIVDLGNMSNLEYVGGSFYIDRNPMLVSIEEMTNLEHVNRIIIQENDALESIQGLVGIDPDPVIQITIFENDLLPKCDIMAVCENLDNPNVSKLIGGNAPGCDNENEIELDCAILDIPDANFLSTLLAHSPTIDTDGDNNIQYTEAEAFTGTINANNKNISNFTGLEAFVNISGFNGAGNQMVTLRMDDNIALTSVIFRNNPQLEAVNLKNGNNTSITEFEGLNCSNLQFVCVDDVTFAEANFTNIDGQVTFTTDCGFLAVPTFDIQKNVILFPNPVSEKLQIGVAKGVDFERATVYSILGEELFFTSEETVNFSQFATGIYFVRVMTDRGSVTKKIVKE